MRFQSVHEIYTLLAVPETYDFAYDAASRQFVVGGRTFSVSLGLFADIRRELADQPGIPAEEMEDHRLLYTYGDFYGLPRFQSAFSTFEQAATLAFQTADVIQSVVGELTSRKGSTSSSMCRLVPGQPLEAVLYGAELHAMAEGNIGEDGWSFKVYEYGINNGDMPEWKIALYAGLGHVAAVAQS